MSGRFKHWVRNHYNLNCFGCIAAPMSLSPDPLKLHQIAFRVCFFPLLTLFPHLIRSLSWKKKKEKLRNRLSSFLQLTSFSDCHPRCLFLFVPDSLNETPRQWKQRRGRGRAAAERDEGKDLSVCRQEGTGSFILRSANVCLSVTVHGRGSLRFGLCVYACVCMCARVCACPWFAVGRKEGREEKASGEKREMKRMSVPLRKCHTGKICRFWSWQINAKPQCKYLIWENFGSRLVS